jgi:hypothetical protein
MLLLGGVRRKERLAAFFTQSGPAACMRGFSQSKLLLRMTRRIGNYLGLKLRALNGLFSNLSKTRLWRSSSAMCASWTPIKLIVNNNHKPC